MVDVSAMLTTPVKTITATMSWPQNENLIIA